MSPFTPFVTQILSLLTIAAQLLTVVFSVALIAKNSSVGKKVLGLVDENVLKIGFVVSLIAVAGSLFYSEIAGYEPCKLCWFQRILMYPQLVLFGLALIKKDRRIIDYAFFLSIIGVLVAGYHYYLQIGGSSILSCSTIGYSVDCSETFGAEFGYITIPLMAFSAFLLMALSAVISGRASKNI